MRFLVIVLSVLVVGLALVVGFLLGTRNVRTAGWGAGAAVPMAPPPRPAGGEDGGGDGPRGSFAARLAGKGTAIEPPSAAAGGTPGTAATAARPALLSQTEIYGALRDRTLPAAQRIEALRQLAQRDLEEARSAALGSLREPVLFADAARLATHAPGQGPRADLLDKVVTSYETMGIWPDEVTRASATSAVVGLMKQTGHGRTRDVLERAIRDASPEVRQAAMLQLGTGFDASYAVPFLLEGLGDSATARIARGALTALSGQDLGADRP
ncbi:MAG: hypothetical protein FJ087_18015, partial [Deltaproteobacteria bacterium]|nr:hypothetical protein [Deltaproteobacteria bacterium]